MRTSILVASILLLSVGTAVSAQDAVDPIVYPLESFGPIGNPAEVLKTWKAAREAHKALTREFEEGKIDPNRLRRSLDRIAALGHKLDHRSVTTHGPR